MREPRNAGEKKVLDDVKAFGYDGPVFAAMQVVWPDAQGRFPWSIGVEAAFRERQTVLEEL
jgi:hypothetical protein